MNESEMPTIRPEDAHTRLAGVVLLDVREDDEWTAGHAPDATHTPLGQLIPADYPAGTTVLCVCRSGGRSSKAVEALRAAGIDAVNVSGGMTCWAAAGLPVIADVGGAPGTVI